MRWVDKETVRLQRLAIEAAVALQGGSQRVDIEVEGANALEAKSTFRR